MGALPRFASAYYVANTLLLATYPLIRLYFERVDPAARRGQIADQTELAYWEKQAAFALLAVLLFRWWRRRSPDHLAGQVFMYGKMVLALMVFLIDARLLVWYCAAFWAVWALLPQPILEFSGDVATLTPTALKEAMLGVDGAWMVFFYSPYQGNSVATAPCFAEAAAQHASPKLRFGAFDVSAWPPAAAEAKVTSNTWGSALPAVVQYEKGREWGRLPSVEAAADPMKKNWYRKSDIVRLFKLEERFTRPLDVAGGGERGKKGQ
ncbi:MAG: hypothetical protein J3K34DRAFT_417232 [Monoraphidium minutum]|nr:MAG: hypothetical protein J3K34DRAFT_417232 [Monoraphidium minutum]